MIDTARGSTRNLPYPARRVRAASLAEQQAAFAIALLDAQQPLPTGLQGPDGQPSARRFAVYRNNVVVGLVETLKAAYPAILRLVGEEFFVAMARMYVRAEPPASPIMLDYGAGFPRFIGQFEPATALPYLRLLREITPYLRSLVRRWIKDAWDIEDAVQDILLTLHSIRHTYDPSRPFGPWLVGIANRRAIDKLRRRGRQALRETPLTAEHEATIAAAGNSDDALEKQHLEKVINDLPPIQRTAVDLLKLKEMSLKEASDATGLSVASLKMATHRALRNLRNLLSDRRDP